MQNSTVITYTTNRCYPVPNDLYATCTGDKTMLLPGNASRQTPAGNASPNSRCLGCEKNEQMIPAEKAAIVCQCSRRRIYRWIEDGTLHFRELPDGTVLVCGVTLAAKLEDLEEMTGSLAS